MTQSRNCSAGKVAVRMAMSRSDLVRKLVMIGTELTRSKSVPC